MTQSAKAKILDAVALTADRYSDWIRCEHQDVNVHLSWVGTGAPVGAWKVELSNDPVIETERQRVVNGATSGNGVPSVRGASSTAKVVDITASITPVLGTGFTVSGGANGSTMFALTAGLAKYFRVWFDHTSDGSAASLASAWTNAV